METPRKPCSVLPLLCLYTAFIKPVSPHCALCSRPWQRPVPETSTSELFAPPQTLSTSDGCRESQAECVSAGLHRTWRLPSLASASWGPTRREDRLFLWLWSLRFLQAGNWLASLLFGASSYNSLKLLHRPHLSEYSRPWNHQPRR